MQLSAAYTCDHRSVIVYDPVTLERICTKCGQVLHVEAATIYNRKTAGIPTFRNTEASRLNLFTRLSDRDCDGKNVMASSRYYRRLDELNNRTMPRKTITMERNMQRGRFIISNLTQKLQLSRMIQERAATLYRKVARMGVAKGRSVRGIATVCVYLACKDAGSPRSVLEFRPLIPYNERKRFFKDYGTVVKYLRPEEDEDDLPFSNPKLPVPPTLMNPKSEIARLASKLPKKLPGPVVQHACSLHDYVREVEPLYFAGKNPSCIAASLLYLSSLMLPVPAVTQNEISNISGISLVSIRSRSNKLSSLLAQHGKISVEMRDSLAKKRGRPWKR